jgi:hypothetical protein
MVFACLIRLFLPSVHSFPANKEAASCRLARQLLGFCRLDENLKVFLPYPDCSATSSLPYTTVRNAAFGDQEVGQAQRDLSLLSELLHSHVSTPSQLNVYNSYRAIVHAPYRVHHFSGPLPGT